MTSVPVARRKYDITPTEMLDIARTAVDAVVAELQRRSEELSPARTGELEVMARHLQAAVRTAAAQAHDLQVEELRQALEAVGREMADANAEQGAAVVEAVAARLADLGGAEGGDRGAESVATALTTLLDARDAEKGADPQLEGLRAAVDSLLERQQITDTSRIGALDRLDEVLVDLRSGITENLSRQHAVLLEVIDERLAELKLTELADTLPARIGEVLSEAVERSYRAAFTALQAEVRVVTEELRGELIETMTSIGREGLEAGIANGTVIERATTELAETAKRATTELTETVGRATTELSETVGRTTTELSESVGRVERELSESVGRVERESNGAATALRNETGEAIEALRREMVDGLALQAQAVETAMAALSAMAQELPGQLADGLGVALQDAVGRHARVERVTSELVWALGEVRGSTNALHAELARLAADLPDAAAQMRDAANRSEARLADLVIRLADGTPDGARLRGGSPPD